jgi:dienelactone hydrolase
MDALRAKRDAIPDSKGTGPFPALKEEDPGLADHVIYRPADLSSVSGQKLGLYIWGNGGCSSDGASARLHLLEVASHGYLAIAAGRIRSGPGATAPQIPSGRGPVGDPPRLPAPQTYYESLIEAIDWALAENAREDSPYYGLIDSDAIAVSGHSCGGLQAIQAGGDPRVATAVVMYSGVFADGSNPIEGMTVSKELLDEIDGPMLYILGGPDDVAYPNGMDDFAKIDHIPVAVANIGVGHGGTFWEPNGGKAAQVVVDWLDWILRGDEDASATFTGDDCRLCTDPDWTFEKKKID